MKEVSIGVHIFFPFFSIFYSLDFQDCTCTLMALEVLCDDALNMCQKLEQYLSQWSVTNVWRQMEGRRRKSRFEELVSTKNRQSAKKSVRNHHNKELPIYCVFCKNNGESEKVYTSHILKSDGKILCPVSIYKLRNFTYLFILICKKEINSIVNFP